MCIGIRQCTLWTCCTGQESFDAEVWKHELAAMKCTTKGRAQKRTHQFKGNIEGICSPEIPVFLDKVIAH